MGEEQVAPDLYVNSVRMAATVYDLTFDFGLTQPTIDPAKPAGTKSVALLRMSPQHALVFERVLRETIEKYQRQIAPIQVPPGVFQDMGIEP
jgi:hypothetical protein